MTGWASGEAMIASVLVRSSAEATTWTCLSANCGSRGMPGSANRRCAARLLRLVLVGVFEEVVDHLGGVGGVGVPEVVDEDRVGVDPVLVELLHDIVDDRQHIRRGADHQRVGAVVGGGGDLDAPGVLVGGVGGARQRERVVPAGLLRLVRGGFLERVIDQLGRVDGVCVFERVDAAPARPGTSRGRWRGRSAPPGGPPIATR